MDLPENDHPAEPPRQLGLRPRLALGFGCLLALLVVLGVEGVSKLDELGNAMDVMLRENYRSVQACQQMTESLERLDSAALFALSGEAARGRDLVATHRATFEAALDVESHNVTLPGEGERAARLVSITPRYESLLAQVLDDAQPLEARKDLYFRQLLPLFEDMKGTVREILELNQGSMTAANGRARMLATRASSRMIVLVLVGFGVAAVVVAILSGAILRPLSRLTDSAREIQRGHLDLVVPVTSKDEIGLLGDAFNAMAATLRELRRSDQAKLLRTQKAFQLAIDSLPDAVALFSPDGLVELSNSAAAADYDLSPGAEIPARHAEWLRPLLAQASRTDGVAPSGHDGALQFVRDGRERLVQPRAIAIRDAARQLLGTTVLLADVTDVRRADEMKNGLLATVSHELRTPLTSLQMALHVLLDGRLGSLGERQTELLQVARKDTERLREIVESLLDLARLESGRQLLRLQPVAPRELVAIAERDHRAELEHAGLSLDVSLERGAPDVLADPQRARLVLANLLTNAMHHTPSGGRIQVRSETRGKYVRFSVSDDGRGIPPEHVDQVFERFFQVPGTEAVGGAGLGLTIAKQVVHAHGGEIHCESRLGHGTTFWFSLPAASRTRGVA